MAYTPELSQRHSCTLRRIAWARGQPMTKTINEVFELLGKIIDRKWICRACRDPSKCSVCIFDGN
jgi:hypothetical protein